MKTKIPRLAATLFAVVTLSPAAFAGPGVGYWQGLGKKTNSSTYTQFVLNDRCKADSCCAKKTEATTIGGGRSAQPTSKSIVACKTSCAIGTKEQYSTCRKGMRV
ncbi:MAG: hypothetical protein V4584_00465 [Verrucomicrobiota bacterium]